jgi:hypothetical protein
VHPPTTSTKDIRTALVDDKDEIRPQYQESTVDSAAIFTSSLVRDLGPQYGVGSTIDALDNIEIENVGGMNELATPWYSDQILPFDITLAGANEYGAMAAAKLFGIEILNEGTGHSIDDAVTEMQATFVRNINPPQTRGNPRSPFFGTFDIRYRRCPIACPQTPVPSGICGIFVVARGVSGLVTGPSDLSFTRNCATLTVPG